MRARIAFDTLAYANKLKAAGLEPKIAEAQAEANADMIAGLLDDNLSTKKDSDGLKHSLHEFKLEIKKDSYDLKQDLTELKKDSIELKQDVNQLKIDVNILKQDVNQLKIDVNILKQDVNQLKIDVKELKQDVYGLKLEIKSVETRLTLRLGAIMVSCMTIMIGVLAFLHY